MKSIYVDLTPYYGILRVSGPDASTFLQGQLTCDIREITETELKLGGHCNLKGRLRALYRIFKQGETFFLEAPLLVLKNGIAQLKSYAKFSKVTIEDVSDQWQIWGVSVDSSSSSESALDLRDRLKKTNSSSLLLTLPYAHNRFQVLQSKTPDADPVFPFTNENDIQRADFEAWKLLDIQQKIPEVWPETVEQLLPHHINLPQLGGVSFNKGCYCGQEIVARMEYRGNIKRALEHITLPISNNLINPKPGQVLYNDQNEEMGIIVTVSNDSENQVKVLYITKNVQI